jgi:hypothetical protein
MWSQNECPGCGGYCGGGDNWAWIVNGYDLKVRAHLWCYGAAVSALRAQGITDRLRFVTRFGDPTSDWR